MYQIRVFRKLLIGISTLLLFFTGAGTTFAVDEYEPDNTPGSAGVILLSTPQERDLDPEGDDDYVQFAATAGEKYVFATSGATETDTVLYLYDLDGTTELASNDDIGLFYNLFSIIFWTCPETGTYYLKVSGFDGSITGAYTLSVNPDLSGSISGTVYESDGSTPITTGGYVDAYTGDPCDVSYVDYGMINADGTYTIQGLPAGNVYLRTFADNYISEWWTEDTGSPDCSLAEPVPVTEGASVTGIDFQLDPGTEISGTVYESDGSTPITTGGYVDAYTSDPCDVSYVADGMINANGTYTIQGLPAGNVYLRTFAYNYINVWWTEDTGTPDCNLAETVQVTEGVSVTGIDFQLNQAGDYTITVSSSPPEGGTTTGGGTYNSGVRAPLTAVPNAGYTFTGWSGDATGTDNPLSVTVDSDKDITANFKKKGRLAFPIRAKGGTILILSL